MCLDILKIMFTIRQGRPEDSESIMASIKELAAMMKCEDQVINDVETFRRDGFGEGKLFHCYVAEVGKEIIGHLLYYYTYSTWVGKTVFMEDFYVKDDHRGKGVGTSLWKAVVKEAYDKGCNRMDWGVLSWNTPAIEFYKRKGAISLSETEQFHVYRLRKEGMENMLKLKS